MEAGILKKHVCKVVSTCCASGFVAASYFCSDLYLAHCCIKGYATCKYFHFLYHFILLVHCVGLWENLLSYHIISFRNRNIKSCIFLFYLLSLVLKSVHSFTSCIEEHHLLFSNMASLTTVFTPPVLSSTAFGFRHHN